MDKKIKEHIVELIPDFVENVVNYIKTNFNETAQKSLENAGGTTSFIINLLGKPLLEKYFKNFENKKLDNFGTLVYLKASIKQAQNSLQEIDYFLEKIKLNSKEIVEIVKDNFQSRLKYNKDNVVLIYRPKHHPITVVIKDTYLNILKTFNAGPTELKTFLLDFNKNIESRIIEEFGDSYEKHLEQVQAYLLQENETDFLYDMASLNRIGFKEGEALAYEKTYGSWKKVSDLLEQNNVSEEPFHGGSEKSLLPVDEMIDIYFKQDPNNQLEKILFIIADFGKGKSVFLRQYASQLAKNYLETQEGPFPVYFNLRNYSNFSSDVKLGVISDYLLTKYAIKIDDDYFIKKQYVFLIDSLDESGELSKAQIDQVILSIKSIQNIDKTKYRTNKIIVTSRPFEAGLSKHIKENKAYLIRNEAGKEIEHFISIHGFKKSQFNSWLFNSLASYKKLEEINPTGFAKTIVDSVRQNTKIDIYSLLMENKTLHPSELRRPIFVYMIYQLILNNIDFISVGKIGVYLSFINFLTKDAKHIDDPNYKVNMLEEFGFRNILHSTSALWMLLRQEGSQGILKKADICRAIAGDVIDIKDERVLDLYKNSDITGIQFLSHSYFGESDNNLHFHHQSFAEILLAEYYLKIFIKSALDDEPISKTRVRLILGEPTLQTISFFVDLLKLLKSTISGCKDKNIIEKRRLLLPLLASIATKKNNEQLFSYNLYYGWFNMYENQLREDGNPIPQEMLSNWFITTETLEKIAQIALNIIEASSEYLLTKVEPTTALIKDELIEFQSALNTHPQSIDKWLALLVGNTLYNEENNYFNSRILLVEKLFTLIKNRVYYSSEIPAWCRKLFIGINMKPVNEKVRLEHAVMSHFNFSNSYLKNLYAFDSFFYGTDFSNCTFDNVVFSDSHIVEANFSNIKSIKGNFRLTNCLVNPTTFIPFKLASCFEKESDDRMDIVPGIKKVVFHEYFSFEIDGYFNTIKGLLEYALDKKLIKKSEIKSWFIISDPKTKARFEELLKNLATKQKTK